MGAIAQLLSGAAGGYVPAFAEVAYSEATDTGSNSIAVTMPTGCVNGDLLLAFVCNYAGDYALTGGSWAATGWTNIAQADGYQNAAVLQRTFAAGLSSATFTLTHSGAIANPSVLVFAVRNAQLHLAGSYDKPIASIAVPDGENLVYAHATITGASSPTIALFGTLVTNYGQGVGRVSGNGTFPQSNTSGTTGVYIVVKPNE